MSFKSIHSLSVRLSQLEGRYQTLLSRKAELTSQVSLAKGRLALHPKVLQSFDKMQALATSRSVGRFERLLSEIIADVMPGQGSIKLSTSVKNNAPALDVWIQSEQGNLEDILRGNGGTIANLVCLGARFITLHRTKNRKLLMLDEPDCWISSNYIEMFSKTLYNVGHASNTQLAYVSHRPLDLQDARFNHVHLKRSTTPIQVKDPKSGALVPVMNTVVEVIKGAEWESDAQVGIRGIQLNGFYTHYDVYVPMFPGQTLYTGEGNVGKSAALHLAGRAIAYNDVSPLCLHHNAAESSVRYDLENNRSIRWSRKPNRNPVTIYQLFENGVEVRKESPDRSGQPPEWVADILGIKKVDGIDIQLPDQKEPIFLLNEAPSVRAKLLSLGRESSHLSDLIKLYTRTRAQDAELVKQGELELARINKQLSILAPVKEMLAGTYTLHERWVELEAAQTRYQSALSFMKGWALLLKEREVVSTSPVAVTEPKWVDFGKIEALRNLILTQSNNHLSQLILDGLPSEVTTDLRLRDTGSLKLLVTSLRQEKQNASLLATLPSAVDTAIDSLHSKLVSALALSTFLSKYFENCGQQSVLSALPEALNAPVLNNTPPLRKIVANLHNLTSALMLLASIPDATTAPEFKDLSALKLLATELRSRIGESSECAGSLLADSIEYDVLMASCQKMLDELGGCPTCGTTNVILKGHVHV